MRAVRNDRTATWHLLGARGCGVDPRGDAYGAVLEAPWATVRDRTARDEAGRCSNCAWPPT